MLNEESYQKLAEKINFSEKKVLKKDYVKGAVIVVGEYGEKERLLKVFMKDDSNRAAGVKKEIEIDKIIAEHNQSAENEIRTIRVVDSGETDGLIWLVREYIEGKTLCQMPFLEDRDIIVPEQLGRMREGYLNHLDFVDQINTQIRNLQEIEIKQEFKNGYKKNIEDYHFVELEERIGFKLFAQVDFYNGAKEAYFQPENIKACMGDLTLANILVNSKNEIVLTDFEWFSFDNKFMDIAFLWLFLWRYPDWQKRWLQEFVSDEVEQRQFQLSVIRILIGYLLTVFNSRRDTEEGIERIRDLYKKHVWLRYLKNSHLGYINLIETK